MILCPFSVQLGDGDIVCFQKSQTDESRQQFHYPDVPLFLEYVRNRLVCLYHSIMVIEGSYSRPQLALH